MTKTHVGKIKNISFTNKFMKWPIFRIVEYKNSPYYDKQILLTGSPSIKDRWISVCDLLPSKLAQMRYYYSQFKKYGLWLKEILDMRPMRFSFIVKVKFSASQDEVWLTELELKEWMRRPNNDTSNKERYEIYLNCWLCREGRQIHKKIPKFFFVK